MTVLDQLGAFAASASVAGLPDRVRAIQRRHFLDAVVALAAGATTGESRWLRPLFDHGDLADRVAFRAATARLSEIDDIDCLSCTTPSSVAVPVALGIAEAREHTGVGDIADAIWVGTELVTRLGAAIGGAEILYRGIWPTLFCAPLGAAATAGRLFGFDARTMSVALSLALQLSTGAAGRREKGRSARWLLFASGVKAGIFAATAAGEGFGGDVTLLDTPDWLDGTRGVRLDVAALTDGLGEASVYDRLSLKPFCCAKQAIAAVEAFRSILGDGIAVDQVQTIEIRVPPPYAAMISRQAEAGNRLSTLVSAAYQCALAARHPDKLYDIARDGLPWDHAVTEIMAKVSVVPDATLLAGFPRRFPALVTAHTAGGPHRRQIEDAWGDPGRAMDDDDLSDKAHRVLNPLIGDSGTAELIAAAAAALADDHALVDLMRLIDRRLGAAGTVNNNGRRESS